MVQFVNTLSSPSFTVFFWTETFERQLYIIACHWQLLHSYDHRAQRLHLWSTPYTSESWHLYHWNECRQEKREKRQEGCRKTLVFFIFMQQPRTMNLIREHSDDLQNGDDDVFARVCGNWTLALKHSTASKQPSYSPPPSVFVGWGRVKEAKERVAHRFAATDRHCGNQFFLFYFDSQRIFFLKALLRGAIDYHCDFIIIFGSDVSTLPAFFTVQTYHVFSYSCP